MGAQSAPRDVGISCAGPAPRWVPLLPAAALAVPRAQGRHWLGPTRLPLRTSALRRLPTPRSGSQEKENLSSKEKNLDSFLGAWGGGGRDGCSSKQTRAVAASQRTVTSPRPPPLQGLSVPPTPGLSLFFFLAPVTGAATLSPAAPRPLNLPWEAPGPQAGSASLVAPPAPEGYYPGQGVTATGVFTLAWRVPAVTTNWSLILGPLAPHTCALHVQREIKIYSFLEFYCFCWAPLFFLNLSLLFFQ